MQGGVPPQSENVVNSEKTCTAISCAPLATPENETPAPVPLPAAIPATWVPCQQPLSGQFTPAPGPICWSWPLGHKATLRPLTVLEKQASSTTFPARKGCVDSTPVSTIAITNPVPSKPRIHASSAPTSGTLWGRVGALTMCACAFSPRNAP